MSVASVMTTVATVAAPPIAPASIIKFPRPYELNRHNRSPFCHRAE